MKNARSDLVAIISVALGQIPYRDLGPLADRKYDVRTELQHELAEYLESQLLAHFNVERRPMTFNGTSSPDKPRPKGWRRPG